MEGDDSLLTVDDFIIKKTSRNWLICRKDRPFKAFHGHRPTEQDCIDVMCDIINGILPSEREQRECARRLLDENEFAALRPQHKKCHYEDKHCVKQGRCFNR